MLVSAVSMNQVNFQSKGKDQFRQLAAQAKRLGVSVDGAGESLKSLRAKIADAKPSSSTGTRTVSHRSSKSSTHNSNEDAALIGAGIGATVGAGAAIGILVCAPVALPVALVAGALTQGAMAVGGAVAAENYAEKAAKNLKGTIRK